MSLPIEVTVEPIIYEVEVGVPGAQGPPGPPGEGSPIGTPYGPYVLANNTTSVLINAVFDPLDGEVVDFIAVVARGPTIMVRQEFTIFYRNGAWELAEGETRRASAASGVTFSVDPVTGQLSATADNFGVAAGISLNGIFGANGAGASTVLVTPNRAVASNGSGAMVASPTTATELAFLQGLTELVQDALNNRILKTLLTAKGSLIGASALNTPVEVPVGPNGMVLVADNTQATGLNWIFPGAAGGAVQNGTRAAPEGIVAVAGISADPMASEEHHYIEGSGGPVIVSANPQIAAGTNTGQKKLLIGRSDTNTVSLANGNGLSLNGDIVLGEDDTLYLYWDGVSWSEIARRR